MPGSRTRCCPRPRRLSPTARRSESRRAMRSLMRISLMAAAALVFAAAHAGAAVLTGVVMDAAGKPLEYANVAVPALHAGAVADEQGRFRIELPPGHYEIAISQIGYVA